MTDKSNPVKMRLADMQAEYAHHCQRIQTLEAEAVQMDCLAHFVRPSLPIAHDFHSTER